MGLLEDLQTENKKQTTCLLKTIFDTLSTDEQDALRGALENVKGDERLGKSKQYSASWLASVLTNNGYPVSRSTITRHMTGECSCEQPL